MSKLLLLVIIAAFTSSCSNIKFSKEKDLIPRRILFGTPDKAFVQLSPNGQYLSYITPIKGSPTVCFSPVQDVLKKDILKRQCISPSFNKGIGWYAWSFNNKHIIYSQDENGSENTGMYIYNIDTKENITIFGEKGSKAFLIARSQEKPDQLLLGSNKRNKKYFDTYILDLSKMNDSYTPNLIFKNDKFLKIIYDREFNIRFAYSIDSLGGKEYFKYVDKKFEKFFKLSPEETESFQLLKFNKDNTSIYVLDSRDSDTRALNELNLITGEVKSIVKGQKADLNIYTISPIEKNIQAVVVNYSIPEEIIIDNSIRSDIDYLKSINKGLLSISQRTVDDKLWLVHYASDTGPLAYYLYNKDQKTAEFLFTSNRELLKYNLLPMRPVNIKSRDGLDLVSYITLPAVSKEDNKLLPLVVYVHGGPNSRDVWGYNPVHQWLANRGYAVLSVNFRGSTGFGKKFLNAGNREWGKKMHYDIIDGVNWAINNKIADPNKIAIMGASYGGYEVLISLSTTPDLFACGIDIVGPSDLVSLLQNTPEYWKPIGGRLKMRVGDINTKQGLNELYLTSPLNFAGSIKKPLLIAQGANDPRVKRAQSDLIVQTLQKKNIPVIYALYPDEGHGFKHENNRLSFYAITEQFLTQVLGGRFEAIKQESKKANVILTPSTRITQNNRYH